MEALARKYRDKAEFLFIYGRESHPDNFGWAAMKLPGAEPIPEVGLSTDWTDCAARARLFRDRLKITRRVLIDEYGEKNVHVSLGGSLVPSIGANAIYVIDGRGLLALRMPSPDMEALDAFLCSQLDTGKGRDLR